MPTLANIGMHIGPFLTGTVQETNPIYSTTPGYMRNMGAGDAFQIGTLVFGTTTNTSNLTYTQTNAASPTGVVVLPAGAYISAVGVDVTTAFNAGTNNTINVAITPTSGSAGTIVFQVAATATTIAVNRYVDSMPATGGIATWFGNGNNNNMAYLVNVSNGQTTPTDQIVQAYFTGTGTGATTGAATVWLDYVVRNADASWYQQTPTYPVSNPPVITY